MHVYRHTEEAPVGPGHEGFVTAKKRQINLSKKEMLSIDSAATPPDPAEHGLIALSLSSLPGVSPHTLGCLTSAFTFYHFAVAATAAVAVQNVR